MNQTIQWDSDRIQNQRRNAADGVLRLPRFFAGTPQPIAAPGAFSSICHCIYHGNYNRNPGFGLIKVLSYGKKCYNSI